jgi:hypothetical protein
MMALWSAPHRQVGAVLLPLKLNSWPQSHSSTTQPGCHSYVLLMSLFDLVASFDAYTDLGHSPNPFCLPLAATRESSCEDSGVSLMFADSIIRKALGVV